MKEQIQPTETDTGTSIFLLLFVFLSGIFCALAITKYCNDQKEATNSREEDDYFQKVDESNCSYRQDITIILNKLQQHNTPPLSIDNEPTHEEELLTGRYNDVTENLTL